MSQSTAQPAPRASMTLNRRVVAGFRAQGTTLASYCRGRGIKRQHARAALIGLWQGPTAGRLRRELCAAAKVDA